MWKRVSVSANPVILATVEALARNDVTHTAGRVVHIVLAARDQVHVAVENGLSCDFAIVHVDVESLHARVILLDHLLLLL